MKPLLGMGVVVLAAALWSGCSVMETRGDCPCWLSVDLVECSDSKDSSIVTVGEWMENGDLLSKENVAPSGSGSRYVRKVPRGYVRVGSYKGNRKMVLKGMDLVVPVGMDCDSIYAGVARVDCSGETADYIATLHKQYSTVFLQMENPTGGHYPYEVRVVGNVMGFSILDLEPVSGEFVFVPKSVNEMGDKFVFRLPRQNGAGTYVEILESGVVQSRIEIGSYIIRTRAFSWESEDLDDIYLNIDFAMNNVVVDVIPWTREYTIEQFRI